MVPMVEMDNILVHPVNRDRRLLCPMKGKVPMMSVIPLSHYKSSLDKTLGPGEESASVGSLAFHIPAPKIDHLVDDFDPYSESLKVHLEAFQLGNSPYSYCRAYPGFDVNGISLTFRYPIENPDGLKALPALMAGETTRVGFRLNNTFSEDIGYDTGRQLMVQFRIVPASQYDVPMNQFELIIEGYTCSDLESVDGVWGGTVIAVPNVPRYSDITLNGTLKISEDAEPYTRLAIRAGVVLEGLKDETGNQSFHVIQRRRLDVVTEPSYTKTEGSKVFVVVPPSISKKTYDQAMEKLHTLNLVPEVFPVQTYGSLNPQFVMPSGDTLKESVVGKLVIILNQAFNPNQPGLRKLSPSEMLPSGCMVQTSGFHPSYINISQFQRQTKQRYLTVPGPL